jgi:hypothetical protein
MVRFVVLLLLVGACADEAVPWTCDPGEGPSMMTFSSIDLSGQDLTCVRHDEVVGCTGECCHAHPISSSATPVACASPCLAFDEASCAGDAECYVARDATAFYSGASDSFIGCFPITRFSFTSLPCAQRDAAECPYDGQCAGLYNMAAGESFSECVAPSQIAGSCSAVPTCSPPPPTCPADRTPGVANGCYTGACIPNALCV